MSNYVFVRSKRTGELSVRRANEFSRNPHSSLPLQERALHYIGRDRTVVCRCSNVKRHYEKTFDIASESKYLNAGLKLYMNRYDLESCRIADFQAYRKRKKAEWANEGVEVDNFHYANGEKSLVCRCPKARTHDYGAPRNPEIIDQCAEFFCLHKSKTSVSKHEWKGVDGDTPAAYSPDSQPNPFCYDSPSAYGFLNNDLRAQDRSSLPPEMEMRSTAGRVAPVSLNSCRNTIPRAPEMPPIIWQNARPAVCVPQRDDSSDTSTLMGTTLPMPQQTIPPKVPPKDYPIQRDIGVDDKETFPDTQRPNRPTRTGPAPGMASVKHWLGELPESFPHPCAITGEASTYHEAHGTSLNPHENDDGEPQSHFVELNGNTLVSSRSGFYDAVLSTLVAELPARPTAGELPVDRPRQRHTPTLKKLEGRDWDTPSELQAKHSTVPVQKAPNCMSASTTNSVCLSSLFEQVFDVVESSLPTQKEFLLQHAAISPRTNLPPSGDCQICNEVDGNQHKRMIFLAQCGHSLHEQCLLGNFRARDERFGRCPLCDSVLCERTLADRIDTDREAIFASQFTPLQTALRIEFPQRGKPINCTSEEEVAATQLRLLKDYTDVHAEELFRLWEDNRAEPDWFVNVVRPVVILFQGWNPALRQSRFFADRGAFLRLIAWAELIRLMEVTRLAVVKSEGKGAMFPQLTELYRKFGLAKDRYEKDKTTWQTDCPGVPGCETIAMNVVKLATDTYLP